MASSLPSCVSQFSWMRNDMGQDPCTIAAWLIILCQDTSSSQPAQLGPLTSALPSYKAPNGTSANACTCSWAFYNNIEACTVCQNFPAKDYPSWSSSCDVLGQSSTTTYWQASVSFSERTKLPRWSILNPSKWSAETFNASEAEEIAGQNLPDVTGAAATQPSGTFLSSQTASSSSSSSAAGSESGAKKTNVGAIAGGVVVGVLALSVGAFAAWWFLLYKKRGRRLRFGKKRGTRRHLVDLDADDDGILSDSPLSAGGGNPLAAHLQAHSLGTGYTPCPTGPQSMQQIAYHDYPVINPQNRSQTFPPTLSRNDNYNINTPLPNIVVDVTRTGRNSRESTTGRIPTVAEQLDEKRRIRAERANPSAHAHRRASSLQVSANPSVGDLTNTGRGSDRAVVSHAVSRSQSLSASQTMVGTSDVNMNASASQSRSEIRAGMEEKTYLGRRSSASADNINTNSNANANANSNSNSNSNTNINIGTDDDDGSNNRTHASRLQRLSLKRKNLQVPWNRRRTVMNLGSDAGSHSDGELSPPTATMPLPLSLPSPLPLGGTGTGTGTVATAGEMITPGEVMAAVPGARFPSAREREKPPPGYIK